VCHGHFLSLVEIYDLHIHRPGRLLGPLKANPPLVVDADAVLAFAVTRQCFKTVAGQGSQVL